MKKEFDQDLGLFDILQIFINRKLLFATVFVLCVIIGLFNIFDIKILFLMCFLGIVLGSFSVFFAEFVYPMFGKNKKIIKHFFS